jgi:hypothetical protein
MDETYQADAVGVAAYLDGQVWYREFTSLAGAFDLVLAWQPSEVIVGISLKSAALKAGLVDPLGFGAKETTVSAPLLVDAVKNGTLAHEHTAALLAAAEGAVMNLTDSGTLRLSVKQSAGSVLPAKLFGWLLLAERNRLRITPKIWA